MRLNICSCLLAFVLGCKLTAGTIRRDAPERTSVTLKCSHDDGGSLVPAWSRNNGEIQQPGRFYVSRR
ncbi:hypothetical protein L3Q82_015357 [Scortum barcoo]|uniref:Uncharacterized protein n=1 Tax=Scortum barcoo TaxID=214431 RepID=A0ACB8VU34_9TELE|nr:hypothetical protein L3Q82_015357 [Scortum barcoo]